MTSVMVRARASAASSAAACAVASSSIVRSTVASWRLWSLTATPRPSASSAIDRTSAMREGVRMSLCRAIGHCCDALSRFGALPWGPMTAVPEKLLLAAPRGYCAGVDRAVQTVEHALDLHGAPVYVRKEIVHNKHVVEQLSRRGAIFVDQETEVPEGKTIVYSAHGVAPSVHANAA